MLAKQKAGKNRLRNVLLYTYTHTQPFSGLLSGATWVGQYQKKHPPTPIPTIGHSPPSSSIHNDPRHPLCSVHELDSPLGQPLSRSSPPAPDPQPHTPRISSPNHHHPLAAHAHTNAARSAATPMARHPHHIVGLKTINSVLSNETDWLLIGHSN